MHERDNSAGSLVRADLFLHWVSGQSRDITALGLWSKQGYHSTGSLIKAGILQHWISDQSRDTSVLGLWSKQR